MKVLCPLTRMEEIDPLADGGADEFFFGFLDEGCIGKSRVHLLWNRRPYPPANFLDYREAERAVSAAVRRGKPIFLTVNELYYSPAQVRRLRVLLERLSASGLSGVVVSSLEMILWLGERLPHLKIIASTTAHVLNSGSVAFFKSFGVARITVPVSVTLREIVEIKKLCPDMEFECFILNESCININGMCLYFHGTESDYLGTGSPCRYLREQIEIEAPERLDTGRMKKKLERAMERRPQGCLCCRIPELAGAGIEVLKIVGRLETTEKKLNFLVLVRNLIEAAEVKQGREYREYAIRQYKKLVGPWEGCEEGRCQAYLETE